ncbi:MAG: hypothetical protein LIO93_01265, partial [Bacteroidales bacterium]|nr:hypothetical protein [Bacteroidales bacterium]
TQAQGEISLCGNYSFENDIKIKKLSIGDDYIYWLKNDTFTYDNKTMGRYGLKWARDSWVTCCASLWLSSYGGFKFFTSGNQPKLTIKNNGDVNITGDQYLPTNKSLYLGSSKQMQLKFDGTNSQINFSGQLQLNNTSSNHEITFIRYGAQTQFIIGDKNHQPNKDLRRFKLNFQNDASQSKVYIDNTGGPIYLRVNNYKQVAAFHTGGLVVDGEIEAKKIVTKTSVAFPDYVFSDNYQLRSLKEVKKHIQEHKHLPEIPSEAEVKENGIDLTELQVKLLLKIEELTLYTIQQQEVIEEQQKMFDSLYKEINQLKNQIK